MKKRYITIPMLILLLTPTILSLLIGAGFVHLPFQKVSTIIVNHDHSETVQSLIRMIPDNRTSDVIVCTDEEDDLKEVFYYDKVLAGIVAPERFLEDSLNGRGAKVAASNDGTTSMVASGIRGTIAEALGIIKSGHVLKLAEGKGIPPQAAINPIASMGYMTRAISNPSRNTAYMMMEGVLLAIVQIGAGYVRAYVCERVSFGSLMKKVGFIIGIACASALDCAVIQILYFGFPYKSSPWVGILMAVFICLDITLSGILQNLGIGGNCEEAAQECSIISLTTLLAGYTSPVIPMSWPCRSLTWFTSNTRYIVPLRDIALVERSSLSETHHVLWLMEFCVVIALLVAKKFRDARAEAGSPLADSPLTESETIGI